MSRVRLLFSEAWSSITANLSTTFAATMTVLIGMFLLGLFIALGTWVLSWSEHVKKGLQVKVYFAAGTTDRQEAFVGTQIRKDHTRVKRVVFISKETAQKQMKALERELAARMRGAFLERFPFVHGHAVAFPFVRRGDSALPLDAQEEILLTADDLGRISTWVERALGFWRHAARSAPMPRSSSSRAWS